MIPAELRQYAAQQGQDQGGGILGHFQQALGNPAVQMFLMSALASALGDKRGTTPFMLMNQQRRNQMLDLARQREQRLLGESELERERDLFAKQKYMGTQAQASRKRTTEVLKAARELAKQGIPGQFESAIPTFEAGGFKFDAKQIKALKRLEEKQAQKRGSETVALDLGTGEAQVGQPAPGQLALDPGEYLTYRGQQRPRTKLGQLFEEQDQLLAQSEGVQTRAEAEELLNRILQMDEAIEQETAGPTSEFERLLAKLPPEKRARLRDERLAKLVSRTGMQIEVGPDGTVRVTQGEVGDQTTIATQTKAEQGIGHAQLARGLIREFRGVLRPENVGLIGDVRRTFFGAVQQGGALARLLEREVGEIKDDLSKSQRRPFDKEGKPMSVLAEVNERTFFDPNLSTADVLSQILAYKLARILDPSGRLSVDDVQRAEKALGVNKILANVPDVLTRLDLFERMIVAEENIYRGQLGRENITRYETWSDQDLEAFIRNEGSPAELSREALEELKRRQGEK
jgi:hypothetical protein